MVPEDFQQPPPGMVEPPANQTKEGLDQQGEVGQKKGEGDGEEIVEEKGNGQGKKKKGFNEGQQPGDRTGAEEKKELKPPVLGSPEAWWPETGLEKHYHDHGQGEEVAEVPVGPAAQGRSELEEEGAEDNNEQKITSEGTIEKLGRKKGGQGGEEENKGQGNQRPGKHNGPEQLNAGRTMQKPTGQKPIPDPAFKVDAARANKKIKGFLAWGPVALEGGKGQEKGTGRGEER